MAILDKVSFFPSIRILAANEIGFVFLWLSWRGRSYHSRSFRVLMYCLLCARLHQASISGILIYAPTNLRGRVVLHF